VSERVAFPRFLHRYAVVVAVGTGILLFVGGLVTSTGSALAVPDWPLSFGKLFPPMTGGVLFEHGHRMVAGTVGLLTIALAVWVWRVEPRRWVRWLGVTALIAVLAQALLGGLTVLLRLPVAVAVSHAGLAEIFFCLTVTIALVTSPGWTEHRSGVPEGARPAIRTLSLVTVGAIYVQILIGALVRHTGAGLAIPDFPLVFGRLWPAFTPRLVGYQMAHRLGALVVTVLVLWTSAAVLRRHGALRALRRPALVLIVLLAWQIYLGAAIIWTRRAVIPTTTHVLSGALLLVTALVLALRAHRLVAPPTEVPVASSAPEPDAPLAA
jgi:cytochrome c oxidase assembly protein subunit 15